MKGKIAFLDVAVHIEADDALKTTVHKKSWRQPGFALRVGTYCRAQTGSGTVPLIPFPEDHTSDPAGRLEDKTTPNNQEWCTLGKLGERLARMKEHERDVDRATEKQTELCEHVVKTAVIQKF